MDRIAPTLDQRRVHVVPLGHEFDRIVEPLRPSADVVYLLVDDSTREATENGSVDFDAENASPAMRMDFTDYQKNVFDEISDFAATNPVPVRLNDFYDVMGVVTTIAAKHSSDSGNGDSVYVNISTGPHVAAVAAAVGCMAVGARPYSVTPERHAHDIEAAPKTQGVAETTPLPLHPIEGPTRDQVAVLDYLRQKDDKHHTVNKRAIIREFDGDGENGDATLECLVGTEEKAWSAKYNKLDSAVLEDLQARGYVDVKSEGRSDNVYVTKSGRNILSAFEHLLDGQQTKATPRS